MTPDEIGEETAPGCYWATAARDVRIKLSVWSADGLAVLDVADAATYFDQLRNVTNLYEEIVPIEGLGERAFEGAHKPATDPARDAVIVVLKAGRVLVFAFTHVSAAKARGFAARLTGRL